MKRLMPLARVAAVVSSVALLGGYIWYRTRSSPAPPVSEETPPSETLMSSTKDAPVFLPPPKAQPELMHGTKAGWRPVRMEYQSGTFVAMTHNSRTVAQPERPPREFFPSSKSTLVATPSDFRALSPSTKVGRVVSDEDIVEIFTRMARGENQAVPPPQTIPRRRAEIWGKELQGAPHIYLNPARPHDDPTRGFFHPFGGLYEPPEMPIPFLSAPVPTVIDAASITFGENRDTVPFPKTVRSNDALAPTDWHRIFRGLSFDLPKQNGAATAGTFQFNKSQDSRPPPTAPVLPPAPAATNAGSSQPSPSPTELMPASKSGTISIIPASTLTPTTQPPRQP